MIGSAADIVRHIADGTRSASSVLKETQALIQARDPELNCFTATTFERAALEAAAVDMLRQQGKPLPPLAGVPYAVKNLFDIAGRVTLAGAKLNESNAPATADATVVARMHRAGAVLVGALNMEELAYGFTTENPHYGTTRNPHDPTRNAGGSSGGSAAAVGAGIVPISLGSDSSRIDPGAGLALRRVWIETHLRTLAPQRHLSLCRQLRSRGTLRRQRSRPGAYL